MRPVHLTLQGFKSHEDRTEFDFADRSLFAIVGPTGAGKSTILDGLSYALYAKTPKVQRSTKSLICTTKDSAEVELVFDVDGRTFTINRSIRRSGAPVHVLTDDAGEKTTGEVAVTEAIEELLHLDFGAFRSSILLAQNRFDEFLQAAPDARMKILKGVFRFDQLDVMRDAARSRRAAHEATAREIEGGLNEIPEDAPELLATASAALKKTSEAIATLGSLQPREKELVAKREKADETLAAARADVEELMELREELPDPKVIHDLVAVEEELAAPFEKATKRVAELKEARIKARSALTGLEDKLGKEAGLAAVQQKVVALVEVRTGIAEATERSTAAAKELTGLEKEAVRLGKTADTASSEVEAAREELRTLERAHAAHVIRSELRPGEPCPVCEQEVVSPPRAKLPATKKTLENKVQNLSAALDHARAAAFDAEKEVVGARKTIESIEEQLTAAAEREKKLATEVAAALGKVKDPAAEVATRLARLGDARDVLERIEGDLNEAGEELDGLRTQQETVDQVRAQVFDSLAHVASTIKATRPDRRSTAAQLEQIAATLATTMQERWDKLQSQLDELGSAAAAVTEALAALRIEAGIVDETSIEDAIAARREEKGALTGRIKTLEDQIARSAELRLKLTETRAEIDVYQTLFDDLANTKFVDFLLEDKRRILSDLASHQLMEMTGRYRFDDSGSFKIVDEFNADTERGIDSLSGGETFLASLALALGLAEAVTRHGGRLRSFFLDEGFGSLDPEALDKALDGIERIVTQDRLIGLVSHVAALADRITDRIQLDRTDDGMTVVVRS